MKMIKYRILICFLIYFIRQLEELNQVITLLECDAEYKISDDKAILFLCKKLYGPLKQVGVLELSNVSL